MTLLTSESIRIMCVLCHWFFFVAVLNFPFDFCTATIHILSVFSNNTIDDQKDIIHTFYIECFISVLFSFVDDVSSLFVVCLLFVAFFSLSLS